MRTDVKVGLVSVFAVVLLVVCYFAMHDNKTQQVVTSSLPTHSTVDATSGGALSITPTTTPSASGATAEPSMTPALANAGGSLLGPSVAYGQASPTANGGTFSGTISPPGASTAPGMGGNVGLTAPGSLNTPMIPAPGLSVPGATTMGSSLLSPMTPPTTMNTTEPSLGGLLPPMPSAGSTPNTHSGNTHSGTSSSHGAIDLTPHRSTIDLTPASGGFGEPSLTGMTSTDASGTYTIAKGDTFGSLAKKNGVTAKAIQAANPGVSSNHLKIGQKIKMPSASAASSSTSSPTSRPASSNRTATTKKSTKSIGGTTKSPGAKAVAGGTYTVKKGDTLRKIAKAVYGDESLWQRIFRANRGEMSHANDLTIGQVIKLPATK